MSVLLGSPYSDQAVLILRNISSVGSTFIASHCGLFFFLCFVFWNGQKILAGVYAVFPLFQLFSSTPCWQLPSSLVTCLYFIQWFSHILGINHRHRCRVCYGQNILMFPNPDFKRISSFPLVCCKPSLALFCRVAILVKISNLKLLVTLCPLRTKYFLTTQF